MNKQRKEQVGRTPEGYMFKYGKIGDSFLSFLTPNQITSKGDYYGRKCLTETMISVGPDMIAIKITKVTLVEIIEDGKKRLNLLRKRVRKDTTGEPVRSVPDRLDP